MSHIGLARVWADPDQRVRIIVVVVGIGLGMLLGSAIAIPLIYLTRHMIAWGSIGCAVFGMVLIIVGKRYWGNARPWL